MRGIPGVGRDRLLDLSFLVGVALKVVNAAGDLLLGIPLLLIAPSQLQSWAQSLTAGELAQDPDDLVANFVLHQTAGLSGAALTYAGVYLLVHAVVKIGILIALARGSLRLYPWVMAALLALLSYQLVDFALTRSPLMLVLSLLDAVVVWLTWREWRHGRVLRDVVARVWPRAARRWPFAALRSADAGA